MNEKFETINIILDIVVTDLIDDRGVIDDIKRADELKEAPCYLLTDTSRSSSHPLLQRKNELGVRSYRYTASSNTWVKLRKLQLHSFSGDLM